MGPRVRLSEFIAGIEDTPLARWAALEPWALTSRAEQIVRELFVSLESPFEFVIADEVAVHRTAKVEAGAVLKGPLVVGPGCFVASGAYLRGGNWIAEACTFGPGAELKSSFVFAGSKLAHFNFVGDSILGTDVNLEVGSVICNYRNERPDKTIRSRLGDDLVSIGCDKFGALVGDHARIGANAVVAPGALLAPSSVVRRGAVRDDEERRST